MSYSHSVSQRRWGVGAHLGRGHALRRGCPHPGQGPCTEEEEEQQCQTPAADRGLKEPGLRTWESTMMFFISKTSRMFPGLFSVWIPFLLGSRTRLGVCFQALNHCYLPSPPRWVGVKGAVPRVPVGPAGPGSGSPGDRPRGRKCGSACTPRAGSSFLAGRGPPRPHPHQVAQAGRAHSPGLVQSALPAAPPPPTGLGRAERR